jgi:hypothetical protein
MGKVGQRKLRTLRLGEEAEHLAVLSLQPRDLWVWVEYRMAKAVVKFRMDRSVLA